MTRVALIIPFVAVAGWGQTLDLSTLDKLASKAKEVNTVTLDAGQIRGALNLLGMSGEEKKDINDLKSVLSGVKNLVVRNFEFGEKGQYPKDAVDAVRAQIAKMPGWTKIVESRDGDEHSEIYMLMQSEKIAGLAVIAAEPTELTVVYINGNVSLSDLGKLHGEFGIPEIAGSGKQEKKD